MGPVRSGAADDHVGLVARVDYLLIVARGHGNPCGVPAEVRHRVESPLHGAEVAAAVAVHAQVSGVGRSVSLGAEAPFSGFKAVEVPRTRWPRRRSSHNSCGRIPAGCCGVDDRGIAAHEHGVEMEAVGEASDYRELHVARGGLGRAGRRARQGVAVQWAMKLRE